MKECVICKQDIKPNAIGWAHGNNAQPVAEGQCCDECNTNKVIPARLTAAFPSMTARDAANLSRELEGINETTE
jgi:hypothetical protein